MSGDDATLREARLLGIVPIRVQIDTMLTTEMFWDLKCGDLVYFTGPLKCGWYKWDLPHLWWEVSWEEYFTSTTSYLQEAVANL